MDKTHADSRKKPTKEERRLEISNRRKIDLQLDKLERDIEELKVYYEQYFIDLIPHPPEKLEKNIAMAMRVLLKSPFKSSATRFRLRSLINRYQTYHTYWERVKKQREEGKYTKDVFKADLRERELQEAKEAASAAGKAEKGMQQLFSSYENALKKSGADTSKLNYDAFRQSLVNQAKHLKKNKGVSKLSYKIVVKNGKVVVKAQVGKKEGTGS